MRLLSAQAELSSDDLRRGKLKDSDFKRVVQASQELASRALYIDDTPALSVAALRTRARRLKRRHGLSLLVVDYLQLVRPVNSSAQTNRVQEIAEITQGLKAIAKELNIPVLALSQLSRAVEQREDKRPQLSDLRESGAIEQDADVVMFVYRDEYYLERAEPQPRAGQSDDKYEEEHRKWLERYQKSLGIADLMIAKQRNGPIGSIKLAFDAAARPVQQFRVPRPDREWPLTRPRAILTVDLGALADNYRRLRRAAAGQRGRGRGQGGRLRPGRARGRGCACRDAGCRSFFVAHLEEGIGVRAPVARCPRSTSCTACRPAPRRPWSRPA